LPYLVGIILAVAVGVLGTLVRYDRDRAYYSTILMVVACFYALFAVMGGSSRALLVESIGITGFFVVAAAGFRGSMWLVAAGLVGHGVFDAFHHRLIANPGVPAWWPAFCGSFDVAAGIYLALLLRRRPA
jgi:hypothetical protein